jgi:hypothetical protein
MTLDDNYRYEEGSENLDKLTKRLIDSHFPSLEKASILILLDKKHRKKNNRIVLGRMMLANDLVQFLTDGFNYVMILDKKAVEIASEEDLIRLIRHELRHCFHDVDSDIKPWKLLDHDVQDFAEELKLNRDNIDWANELATRIENLE